MAKSTVTRGVSWTMTVDRQWVPHFRWKTFKFNGAPRPFQRFLKGERKSVGQYLYFRVCEEVFGEAPVIPVFREDGSVEGFKDNPNWDRVPEMFEDKDAPFGWRLTNGNPDIMNMLGQDNLFFDRRPEVDDPEENGG